MSRCELSGKGPVVKNLVSHSNIKTKSTAFPNVQNKKLHSQALCKAFGFKIATSTLRTVESMGGLDAYLLNQNDEKLSKRALGIKTKVLKKLGQNTTQN